MSTQTNPAFTDIHATPGAPDQTPGLPEYNAEVGEWDAIAHDIESVHNDRIAVNMGPVHPSTHGVLRVIVELEGETVKDLRLGTGYLHTGIEKSMEYRTFNQGVAFCTRMDYVAPMFQEVAWCLAVEKVLGITDQVPGRASEIRVLMMELNRIASHLVAVGTGANELGATTMLTTGFRAREEILRIFEHVTGLRMNHAYMRPGGVANDLLPDTVQMVRDKMPLVKRDIEEMQDLIMANPIFLGRTKKAGYMPLSAMMALGLTGPCLRAGGLPLDLRKTQPYCGYETYSFDVATAQDSDVYARTEVRFEEMFQSLRIVYQALDRLEASAGQPVMVADKKLAIPGGLTLGPDGQGQNPAHVAQILGSSMEELIHHFKLVTEGYRIPPGQVFQKVEHAKGIFGVHLVTDGGTHPYRAHFREPSYSNLQSASMMCEGGLIADLVVSIGSLDPVFGGVDR
ncbi:NADH-quinone oxidoreductase subunit D [Mobiluncus mulieris]|uniref:NADH-quinone oxidoreductase subunit D n=1 Tax=Mobiluncus mulieris TaxID=2052 RepID=A0A7Y0U1X1_9ACTO|nr:NADH-quinone oxidoreductase subunit D [Mobiluncus mulieris]NMW65451.1 NADH-quinone oxidoreductase subunit D [Mobiluncus mulieris]